MSSSPKMEKDLSVALAYPDEDEVVDSTQVIYIDPEKEKAAFKKFDRYVVPASFIFMLLCALDRNNVSETYFPAID
jgi:hypothetical protein